MIVQTTAFGEELKKQRKKRGMSQSWLATRADFDHSYISRLESGTRLPTSEAVAKIARALKADAKELDTLRHYAGFSMTNFTERILDEPEVQDILLILADDRISSAQKKAVRSFLRNISEVVRAGGVLS